MLNFRHVLKEVWYVSFEQHESRSCDLTMRNTCMCNMNKSPPCMSICPQAPAIPLSVLHNLHTDTLLSTKPVHPHSWLMITDRSRTDKHNARAGQLSCLYSPLDTSLTSCDLSSLQAALPVAWHSLAVYLLLPGTTNKRMRRASLGQPG